MIAIIIILTIVTLFLMIGASLGGCHGAVITEDERPPKGTAKVLSRSEKRWIENNQRPPKENNVFEEGNHIALLPKPSVNMIVETPIALPVALSIVLYAGIGCLIFMIISLF